MAIRIQLFVDFESNIGLLNLKVCISEVRINWVQLFESFYELGVIRFMILFFEDILVETWRLFRVWVMIMFSGEGWKLMNFCKLHIFCIGDL